MVWTDRNSGLRTLRNILQVDRGMSYEVCSAPRAAVDRSWARCLFPLPLQAAAVTKSGNLCMQVAVQRLNHDRRQGDSSGFRRSRRPIFGQTMYLLALQVPCSGLTLHCHSSVRPTC